MYEYSYSVDLWFERISGTFVGDQPMSQRQLFWAEVKEVAMSLVGR